MSPADHNKTLVVLYSLLSGFFILPLVGAPWIIEKNVRSSEQIPIAVAIGFPCAPTGITLPVYNAGVVQKKALRTKTGSTFGGDIVAALLAGSRLHLAIHAHRRRQKDV
jgi:hypothetical protein